MRVTHPQWRSQLENVRYPFADSASLTNDAGDAILDGTFLDATVYPQGNEGVVYVSSIVVSRQKIRIYLGTSDVEQIAYGEFNTVSPPEILKFVDMYGRPAGLFVSESIRLAIFQSWKQGTHTFTLEQTELAVSTVIPKREIGVRGFILPDGSVMTGDVWFVGEDGVVLEYVSHTELGDGVDAIRINVVGDPLFRRRLCTGQELFQTPRFVKKLIVTNNCDRIESTPDDAGNIQIFAASVTEEASVLRIVNTGNGITFKAVGEVT